MLLPYLALSRTSLEDAATDSLDREFRPPGQRRRPPSILISPLAFLLTDARIPPPMRSIASNLLPAPDHFSNPFEWRSLPSYLVDPISDLDPDLAATVAHSYRSQPHIQTHHVGPTPQMTSPMTFQGHDLYPFSPTAPEDLSLHPLPNYQYATPDIEFQRILDLQMNASLLTEPNNDSQNSLINQHDQQHDDLQSPASITGSFASNGHFDMSPSQSPIDARVPLELPSAGNLHLNNVSPKHEVQTTIICPTIQEDHMLSFDSTTHSFSKRPKASHPTETDPYAAAFLQEQIGDEKWNIFSARLYERRLGGSKARPRGKKNPGDTELRSGGASAIEFLVKVEVVKEVLRVYVPHPYNPFKSLTHAYDGSPSGYVVLTRSTILSLSGWSNTQFSYWARRAEAVSVLAQHDPRLQEVAVALERRLHPISTPRPTNPHIYPSPSSPVSPLTPLSSLSASISPSEPTVELPEPNVTGKGLDQLIDAVKRRTGASPFLRGKHASLDPFGTPTTDRDAQHIAAPGPGGAGKKKRKRRESESTTKSLITESVSSEEGGMSTTFGEIGPKIEPDFDDGGGGIGVMDGRDERHVSFRVSASRVSTPPTNMTLKRRRLSDSVGDERSESFPVSDSRSEMDGTPRKRMRTGTL
ncbi:hypothetical protein EW146_g6783 [Bondarzewia mesenterica]|uniref:Uncharacterized protein n=1 Tax=Bondarzewia mesenterica TaxID=1095465 RepID=A0A4S4LN99_9AGAM|nr:hypothetical protein EW146_g6783 [Bondarzewia mesenterica]